MKVAIEMDKLDETLLARKEMQRQWNELMSYDGVTESLSNNDLVRQISESFADFIEGKISPAEADVRINAVLQQLEAEAELDGDLGFVMAIRAEREPNFKGSPGRHSYWFAMRISRPPREFQSRGGSQACWQVMRVTMPLSWAALRTSSNSGMQDCCHGHRAAWQSEHAMGYARVDRREKRWRLGTKTTALSNGC